jgi:precorrin isomerase/sirohydrochlorin ferrochelatase
VAVSPPGNGVHPIEVESYRILAERVDLSGWPPGPAAVAARVVHATAEPALVPDLVVPAEAVDAGVSALARGAPVLCDVEMVRAAVTGADARCLLGEVTDAGSWPSRSAAAMARAAERHPEGAVVVVGCAPTALAEVNRRLAEGTFRPAMVVGVPVGYVGASEAKEALLEVGAAAGVPTIVLRGERGGAAVGAAIVNALGRLADAPAPAAATEPALFLLGHGTRSGQGADELRAFTTEVAAARPERTVGAGFIEFMEPDPDTGLDQLVDAGAHDIVVVPLVLLGAGHMKDDGPAALVKARVRHPGAHFHYSRDFGVGPAVLAVVEARAQEAARRLPGGAADAVVLVGRGSTDPDANAELAKAARLLADSRGLATALDPASSLGLIEPAFVSLAPPDVDTALHRCHLLGARRIAVVPYFLFTGLLVERIAAQAAAWQARTPGTSVVTGLPMGVDRRLVDLVWERFDEAATGPVHMNCDGCLYRAALPGYEHRVGVAPFTSSAPPAAAPPPG